jgi:hypothetical protein
MDRKNVIRHYRCRSGFCSEDGGESQPRMESGFQCASCGEWNETVVDPSAGSRQSYVEDCQVCCKPNVLRIEYENETGEFWISAELE